MELEQKRPSPSCHLSKYTSANVLQIASSDGVCLRGGSGLTCPFIGRMEKPRLSHFSASSSLLQNHAVLLDFHLDLPNSPGLSKNWRAVCLGDSAELKKTIARLSAVEL